MDWSNKAREVIAATLAGLPVGATVKEKRAALKAAYPFGVREYWPYRAWLKAVRVALGLDKKRRSSYKIGAPPADQQCPLFGDDK